MLGTRLLATALFCQALWLLPCLLRSIASVSVSPSLSVSLPRCLAASLPLPPCLCICISRPLCCANRRLHYRVCLEQVSEASRAWEKSGAAKNLTFSAPEAPSDFASDEISAALHWVRGVL